MRELLSEIEDKSFAGKPKLFEVFRRFDQDGDGFVSYKDFETTLLKNKVRASKAEVSALMRHFLDGEGNGYIGFSEFSKRFGPEMSFSVDVPQSELHLPNLCPNREKLHEYGEKQKQVRKAISANRKAFQPEIDQSKHCYST